MILLDTHAWFWWVNGSAEMLPSAEWARLASEPGLAVSAMSCLEMAWLVRRGRITLDLPLS